MLLLVGGYIKLTRIHDREARLGLGGAILKSTGMHWKSPCGKMFGVRVPRPIFLSKEPFTIKCPACSEIFDIKKYGGDGHDRAGQMEQDYHRHFKAKHAHEAATQAVVRIARKAAER
jgi:hypothetical protein